MRHRSMLRKIFFLVFFFGINLPAITHSVELSPASSIVSSTICWPLNFSGITLGINNDAQVRRLLGSGVYKKFEGDTGGRYFIDRNKSATLHTVMYTDSIVGELTITSGIDSSLKALELKQAVSIFFNPEEGFGNWHELHLGSSKADVINNLGQPKQKNNDDSWVYFTSCTCEIPQFLTINFKSDKLYQLILSAPAG